MTITAPVYKVLDTETFPSGFKKRKLVLKTTGEYPQIIPFEFTKDRTELLDNLQEGQIVTVHYDIRGNEYNGKFYSSLQAWKVDSEENGSAVIASAAKEKALNGDMANQFNEQQDDVDDLGGLPF